MLSYLWLIPILPLVSFVIISLVTRRVPRLSGFVCIAAIFGSFILSCLVLIELLGTQSASHGEAAQAVQQVSWPWITLGSVHLDLGLMLDPLAAVMLIVVTFVSLLVQIYSQGYMRGDPGYSRYFAFMSVFTMSMLGLVLANNFLQLFICWELVGACSYLLIGFWFQKPEAAAAAKKAFIVTRFGDLGFLAGILLIYAQTGSVAFDQVEAVIASGAIGGLTVTLMALLLFAGAVGKSAQFPLHVWLPDAMEGPTPVSALIHAATMVAAGVYMVARLMFIFETSQDAMLTVAGIGAFTAIFAASMGLVSNDIKRVLAFSTVSQLGYMMLALGVGGYVAGVFHLMNHAFFKALLFLGAGSVIHAAGTQDIREMGGLRKVMPITFTTFTIGSLSLAGIFPLSGFWSKDEILADTLLHGQPILFVVGLIAAFMTAFYMFRVIFVAFFGEYRGGARQEVAASAQTVAGDTDGTTLLEQSHPAPALATSGGTLAFSAGDMANQGGHGSGGHGSAHGGSHDGGAVHESPWVMTIPLILLSILAICSGLLNINGGFAEFLGAHAVEMNIGVAAISLVVALAGIGLAWVMYHRQLVSAEAVGRAFGPVYGLVARKYYVDEFYLWVIKVPVMGVSQVAAIFDKYVVDTLVNLVGWIVLGCGAVLRKAQTGQVQAYALVFFLGVFVIVATLIYGGR